MNLFISFVLASLFCLVLIVPAEAQQLTKQKPPEQEVSHPQPSNNQDTANQSKQPATQAQTTAQEKEVVKSPHPCFSDERIREYEEQQKQLEEIVKQIPTNPDYKPPSLETIQNMQRYRFVMKVASLACKIRLMVEIQIASRDENFKKEQLDKVSDAATRIAAEFNVRGRRASFSGSDLDLLQAYVTAVRAKDVIEKAASAALTKEMKKEQSQHAIEMSKAVLRKFNETGELASVSSESKRVIDVFLMVVLATETIQKAGSPKLTKNLKQEEIQEAIKTSNRILTEFKTNEWNSKFADNDEKTLENFQKTLSATEEGFGLSTTHIAPPML